MMKFKIKKVPLSYEEKLERAKEYKKYDDPDFDINAFCKKEIYDEFIDFRCLNCGKVYKNLEADIVFELFDPAHEEYPELICNNCEDGTIVPIDIYDKINEKKSKKKK